MPKKPLLLMILDGWGINPRTGTQRHRPGEDPEHDAPLRRVSLHRDRRLRPVRRASRRADGELRGGAHQHRGRPGGLPGPDPDQQVDRGRRFLREPGAARLHAQGKAGGGRLHLAGLLSDGGVHSHETHLYALLEMAKRQGLREVFVHCLMDGRDTPPQSGADYLSAAGGGDRQDRGGQDRHGDRPLLRHGPRQPLGAGREGLSRHRLRRGETSLPPPRLAMRRATRTG